MYFLRKDSIFLHSFQGTFDRNFTLEGECILSNTKVEVFAGLKLRFIFEEKCKKHCVAYDIIEMLKVTKVTKVINTIWMNLKVPSLPK